ncbi:MAG: RHS repeat protein, partial [Limnobacter sp.]|nr:RHS repeat protein [Limnobacter sp.]
MPGLGAETGQGAIGPGTSPIGGRSPGDLVSELVGASSPTACQASGSTGAGAAEPASLPPESPGASAGNPVDLVTGNKYERRVDVIMPDPESGLGEALVQALGNDALRVLASRWPAFAPLELVFSRHYNSRFDAAGPMGPGWRHAFETALARLKGRHGVELQVVQADGRRIVFRRPEPGLSRAGEAGAAGTSSVASHFVSDRESDGEIEEDLAAVAPWRWRWPDGRVVVFDGEGRLARIDAPDRDHVVVQRDRAGRIRALVDGFGRRLQLEYLGDRLHAVALPDGNRIGYDYDRHGVLVAVRYPDGRVVRYGYEDPRAFHLLTSIERPDGSTSHYRYDDASRVVESVPASGPQDAVSFEYRLPGISGEAGRTVVRQGGRSSTWHWQIDDRGRGRILSMSGERCASCPVLEAVPALAEPAPSPASELAGRGPVSATPRSDPVIELKRDALGLPAEARVAGFARTSDGRSTPIGIHVRWQRHLAGPLTGKLSWVERLGPDGTAARTSFFHDSRRSLVTVVQPGGLIHRFERDALGRATAQQRPDRARLEARFDPAWRLVSWRVRGELAAIDWGEDGRPSSIAWPSGDRWTLQFRSDGVEVRSNRGWIARTDDSAVAERSDAADTAGTARGAAVALAFGGAQPLVVDAAGRSTRHLYDDFGRLVEVDSSASGYRRLRHDAWGRVVEVDSPFGVIERRRYDLAGRLAEREQLAASERIVTRFEWDGALLVGVEHPVQQTRVEHDAAGLVSAVEHRLLGKVQRWTFERDDRDRVIARGMPDGDRVIYRYDETGRPSALVYQAPGREQVPIVDAVRFRVDRAVAWRLGNGVRFERADDAGGRPLAWRWRGSSPLPEWRYRWGEDGLPAAIVGRSDERRFGWDALGRLIVQERHGRSALQRANAPESEYFAWDLAGDLRLVKTAQGITRGDAELAVPRDALGRPARHGVLDLRYGAQQRIVAVDRGSEPIARYSYNASGVRAIKTVGTKTSGFLYRGRRLAAETDAEGRISRHYLYWLGNPVAIVERRDDGPRVFWLHGDHLGTPHAATDASGRQVWQA